MSNHGSTYTKQFAAVPESVPRARSAVTKFARAAGAQGDPLESIRLAASEGVTNAVLHAYRGGAGAFEVSVSHVQDELWLLISDDGHGLSTDGARGGLGLGLVLIARLTDEFEIVRRSGGGIQLQMRFSLRTPSRPERVQPGDSPAATLSPA